MSIQFRSRITPAIDYSTILTNYGWCCSTTQPGLPIQKTYVECITEGGYFMQGASGQQVVCPDADTELGCCCACSYVDPNDYDQIEAYPPTTPYLSSGTRSQTTRCECNRLGGIWSPTSDGNCEALTSSNWETFCVRPDATNPTVNIDVRSPRSCCHLVFDTVTGFPTGVSCKDVCTSGDCALLSTETYPSVFDSTKRCSVALNSAHQNTANCASPTNLAFLANAPMYQDFDMGSCYTLEDINGTLEYTCQITPQSLCSGHWIIQQDSDNAFCLNALQPTNPVKSNNVYQPQTMNLEDFNALGLTAGDEYLGGIYIGTFNSGLDGRSSIVYGNLSFGTPTETRFVNDQNGGTASTWALIVDPTPYTVSFLLSDEIDADCATSLWDGYYNIYGNGSQFDGIKTALATTIKYTDRNAFIDYYLPSIYELQFYAHYLNRNNIKTIGNLISSSIFNTKYLNNRSSRAKINGNSFVYGLGINENYSVNYKTLLIDKKTTETALFFRRIILT